MFDEYTSIARDNLVRYLRDMFDVQAAFDDAFADVSAADAERAARTILAATWVATGELNDSIPEAIAADGPERDEWIDAIIADTDSPDPVPFADVWRYRKEA